jgi:hypothetical protein
VASATTMTGARINMWTAKTGRKTALKVPKLSTHSGNNLWLLGSHFDFFVAMEKCPMLMECQQVETCYIGREQYKNALNRTMDLTANPSLGSAGL